MTDEEREIVLAQGPRVASPPPPPPAAYAAAPNREDDGRWHGVLSSYAEHLTDEELSLVRAQLV